MKRLTALSLLGMFAALTISMPAEAQSSRYYRGGGFGDSINRVQNQLQARINQGIASGRLSQSEASRLRAKLSKIEQMEARMRNSGNRLTMRERTRLNNELTNLTAQLTRDLNDYERRRVGYWGRNNRPWR